MPTNHFPHQQTNGALVGFERFLAGTMTRGRRPLSARTQEEVVGIVRRSLARGGPLAEAMRTDISPGYRQLARYAALLWGRYGGTRLAADTERHLATIPWRSTYSAVAVEPLTPEELRRFEEGVRSLRDPDRAVLQLLTRTALRVGDLLRLTRDAVDEGRTTGALPVATKGARTIQYPYRLLRGPLERLRRASWGILWESLSTSQRGADRRVRHLVHRVARDVGLEDKNRSIHPHVLRHTMAIHAQEATGDLHLVSLLLGHGSTSTTELYLRGRPVQDLARALDRVRELRRR